MRGPSDFDRDRIVSGLVRAAEDPSGAEGEGIPLEYLGGIQKALHHLAQYTANGPDIERMKQDERRRYVVGYALPIMQAGMTVEMVWTAVHRYKQVGGEYFPKNPAKLLEMIREIEKDPAHLEWRPAPSLPSPPPSRDERNRQRVRLGLEPLPEKE